MEPQIQIRAHGHIHSLRIYITSAVHIILHSVQLHYSQHVHTAYSIQ
jgi:hypothetical protein